MSLLTEQIETARSAAVLGITGHVVSVTGMTVQAVGLPVPAGLRGASGDGPAEVMGFRDNVTTLMTLFDGGGLARGQRVRFVTHARRVAVGPGLLGRVVDGMGRACDGGPAIEADVHYALDRAAPEAMSRARINQPLSVGIRSINALLTAGCGGRLGIFAGTGVGKSVLLGMMARYTSADVTVVALVGERGRE